MSLKSVSIKILELGRLLKYRKKFVYAQTYYPEYKMKSRFKICLEQISEVLKYNWPNLYYFVYGFDVKQNHDDYLAYKPFMLKRDKLNSPAPYSYICLLRDKSLFTIFGEHFNMPVVSNLAEIQRVEELNGLLKRCNNLFLKPTDSMCGNGTMSVTLVGEKYEVDGSLCSYEELSRRVGRLLLQSPLIVQKLLKNHRDINRIYSKSINTIRIVTVNPKYSNNPVDIVVLGTLLRIGANGSVIDNWAKGGLVVGINPEDGSLMKYGFYKPGYGTKTKEHPDMKFKFEGFKIPYYEDVIRKCKNFHSKLDKIHSIGWDVAITDDGPLFIEANDNWELGFVQVCFGGIKQQFDDLFK